MSATNPLQRPSFTLTLVDREGTVQYQSSAVEVLLGYKPEEMAGTAWFSFVHADDAAPVRDQFGQLVREHGEHARWVLRFRGAEGGWRPVEVRAKNLLEDPDVQGILLSLRALL